MSTQVDLDRLADPKQVLAILEEAGWTYRQLTQGINDGTVAIPESQKPPERGDQ